MPTAKIRCKLHPRTSLKARKLPENKVRTTFRKCLFTLHITIIILVIVFLCVTLNPSMSFDAGDFLIDEFDSLCYCFLVLFDLLQNFLGIRNNRFGPRRNLGQLIGLFLYIQDSGRQLCKIGLVQLFLFLVNRTRAHSQRTCRGETSLQKNVARAVCMVPHDKDIITKPHEWSSVHTQR